MKQEKRASPRCFIQSLSLHFSQWSCAWSSGWVLLQHRVLLHDVQMQSDDKMPSKVMNGSTYGEKDFKSGAVFPKLWYAVDIAILPPLSYIWKKKKRKEREKVLFTATCPNALRMPPWNLVTFSIPPAPKTPLKFSKRVDNIHEKKVVLVK